MRKAVGILMASILVVMLSGCLEVHRPVVPATLLEDADHDWQVIEGDVEEGDNELAPKVIETEYRFVPDDGDSSFPGVLVLVGLRTLQRIDEATLIDGALDILEDEMAARGVEADTVTEKAGSRTITSGATTQWVTMTGTASSQSLLFSQAEEIRVLAEAWFDDASNEHVVAIVIAQTGGSGVFGPRTDLAVWNELVGDVEGSIDGATHSEGFIDHVVIQD